MITKRLQAALYGVALALDAFLVNGIQYGVLQQAVFPGILEKTASNLLMTLTNLEQHGVRAAVTSPAKVREIQTALRAKCQQEIALVTALGSFRTLPPEQLHAIVSRIPLLREECAQLIQELEPCHRTPNPFYQTRPNHLVRCGERVSSRIWNKYLLDAAGNVGEHPTDQAQVHLLIQLQFVPGSYSPDAVFSQKRLYSEIDSRYTS